MDYRHDGGLPGAAWANPPLHVLYFTTPNATVRKRWVSPGAVLTLVVWIVASVGFAFYVANFGSYNKTYGALAGPIIFLLWLWITNICVLLGAELNAELERSRALEAGEVSSEKEQFVELRDTEKLDDG